VTVEFLQFLRSQNAFDHQPTYEALREVHVPFDHLTGSSRVEARLEEAGYRNGRVALIGSSGCGKSSVISYVFGPELEGIAPLVVPVSTVPAGSMIEPSTVADHLIQTVARRARSYGSVDSESESEALTRATARKPVRTGRDSVGRVGVSFGWIKGELGADLTRQTEAAVSITPEEKLEVVQQLLFSITDHGLSPVLIFDDTDRWLRGLGHEDPLRVVQAFFGRVVRWIADLGCGVVVSVHNSYFTAATPKDEILEFLDTPIDIPGIPSEDALRKILTRRVSIVTKDSEHEDADAAEAFEPGAIEHLFGMYREGKHHLRWAIRTAHVALTEACDASSDYISAASIDAAAAADQ
jgi:hypothetical protein